MSLTTLSKRLPLRTVLVVPFALEIFVAVGLTGYLSYRNGQEAVEDLATQLQKEVVFRIEERLDNYLSAPKIINRINADSVRLGQLAPEDTPALERHFIDQIRLFSSATYIYFGSSDGKFIGVGRNNDGSLNLGVAGQNGSEDDNFYTYQLDGNGDRTDDVSAVPDYNLLLRPWYVGAVNARQSAWGDIYIWAAPYANLALPAVLPIYRQRPNSQGNSAEKDLLGVFAVDMSLLDISTFLQSLDVGKTGQTFIVDYTGQLVASSTDEPPFGDVEGKPVRLAAGQSNNPLVSKTATHILGQLGSFGRLDSSFQTTVWLDGEKQLIQVTPFRLSGGLNWAIVVVIPERDFMARIHANTRTTIALCVLALAVSTGIGILTARWIVAPISQLNASAKSLADGNWNHRSVQLDRQDEIGELAQSFNHMASQLQDSFASLQAKNEQMQRLDELKDEFLANTSHELRTPLNGTIGIAESMLDGVAGELNARQRQNLTLVVQSCYRLNSLVNDILDFSKLRHKAIELQRKPVGIREIVDAILRLCQPLVKDKDLTLVNAISPAFPLAHADENRLQQILYNLVGNAIKFTDEGFIGVSAELLSHRNLDDRKSVYDNQGSLKKNNENDDKFGFDDGNRPSNPLSNPPQQYLAITVADTGIGIPANKLDRIFESFEQADGSTSRQYGGTGLGLAVTKQLVSLHGGDITVKSVVGKGSQFTFTLPTIEVKTDESIESEASELSELAPTLALAETIGDRLRSEQHGLATNIINRFGDGSLVKPAAEPTLPTLIEGDDNFKILIVDDEPINLQVLVNHLSPENFAVTQASNGVEALALIERGLKPDLILLDVMMPRMTGYEVTQTLREKYPSHELPILMLTAKNQSDDIVQGLSKGANDYLTKPIKKRELLARLKTHLRLSNLTMAYAKFVPREFLNILSKESILDVKLGDAVQQEMSVLFSDIRDFTPLSEGMSPEDNFRFINGYLSQMEPAIRENNGFIDKYIGDAIMALFPGNADDSLKAAIAMLRQLKDYNRAKIDSDLPTIRTGIGINTGSLMLGTVGGEKRMDTTAISDAVNLASRIESLTKVYGVSLLISDRTFIDLRDSNQYRMRIVDRVVVKGKTENVTLFEVFDTDLPGLCQQKEETRTRFEQGVMLFHNHELAKAKSCFDECLEHCPEDSVSKLYLERFKRFPHDPTY
ncbi:MAG: response regulator [Cyanobacteria bacterium P01_D01_bin.73]